MSEQNWDGWKMVRGTIPVIKLNLYNPSWFLIDERKTAYGQYVKIGPIAQYICEASLWEKKDEKISKYLRTSSLNYYFEPKKSVFLNYRPNTIDDPKSQPAWLGSITNPNTFETIWLCDDYHDAESIIAGWTCGVALAYLHRYFPQLVGSAETYAYENVNCADETKLVTGSGFAVMIPVNPVAPMTTTIAVARTDFWTDEIAEKDMLLIAASKYFLSMEQTLQQGAKDMAHKVASVSRRFHPRTNKNLRS